MFDAGDLAEDLLCGPRDHVLHVLAAGARECDQHVGHRDVDLWLFLAWRDHDREKSEQQRDKRQKRGNRVVLERRRDASGNAELFGGWGCGLHCRASALGRAGRGAARGRARTG